MRRTPITTALLLLTAVSAAPADEPRSGEWRPLFNGRDLEGWEHVGPGKMVVEDGAIRTEGGMGLLWYTREKLGNCTLRVVYKQTGKRSNGGVFVRIADRPKDAWWAVHHGYEAQINDSDDDYHCTGVIYSLTKAKARPGKVGEWNTMEITLKGDRILVTVNGEPVTDFDPKGPVPERKQSFEPERGPRPESGYVGIQNHDDYSGGKEHVDYKEVSVRPLVEGCGVTTVGRHTLFDGKLTLKIYEEKGKLNYRVYRDAAGGEGRPVIAGGGPAEPRIERGTGWFAYAESPDEVWIYDGRGALTLREFSDRRPGYRDGGIYDSTIVPDIVHEAPRAVRDRLPEAFKARFKGK